MYLIDYFAPLNFFNFSVFLIFFLAMDIIGFNLASLLKFPDFLRIINWIFGLGIFIFIWFLLHFFLPFRQDYIAISIISISVPFLFRYIKIGGTDSLIRAFQNFPYPLIFLLPIIQKLFFLISMPPYVNDELAYHYISPAELLYKTSWDFGHNINFYYMLPKTLETSFNLMFALTNTYAVARLLNFMIFLTSIIAVATFLKERTNIIIAICYSLFTLLLFTIPLVDSTRGYIDVAPAILANLLLITSLGWFILKEKGYLYSAFALVGLMMGIKYTVLGFVASVIIFSLVFIIIRNISEIKKYFNLQILKNLIWLNLPTIFIVSTLVIIMGGYWYIKNYIITGNPIYPFVFKCKDNISCGDKNEFFDNFGIQFRIDNLSKFIQVGEETLK